MKHEADCPQRNKGMEVMKIRSRGRLSHGEVAEERNGSLRSEGKQMRQEHRAGSMESCRW